jgi:hypothetical protein
MDNNPVTERCIELAKTRAWIANKLSQESNRKVRNSLFGAVQAIGFAILRLEQAEYLAGRDYSDSEN